MSARHSNSNSHLSRVLTLFLAALVVFGGWSLLKARVFTPRPGRAVEASRPPASRQILWTPKDAEIHTAGDDPRAEFTAGLTRYLGEQVSSASALSTGRIDPAMVSQSDDAAEFTATVQGVQYFGRLEWTNSGWQLVELSRAD
jgi:hypothetical protein